MIIKVDRNVFSDGIDIVSKAVASKTSLPILECILIEAEKNRIKLTANNKEIGIETTIEGIIIEDGMAAVEAKLFSGIIRKMPEGEITIDTSDSVSAVITNGDVKISIPFKSGKDFITLPDVSDDKKIRISQYSLREIINQTRFSISDSDANIIMTGENFSVKDNCLTAVSIDGRRISLRKIELKGANEDINVTIPGKTLNELIKIINGGIDDEVVINVSGSNVMFRFGNTKVVSRTIEGEYFKISRFMTIDQSVSIEVNRRNLIDAIERTLILIQDNDKKAIIISIKDDNKLYIRVDTNIGSLNESVDVAKEGGEIIAGFNNRYLLDALNAISDETVKIYFNNSKTPCLIKDDEETYTYVILPININTAAYK